MTHETRDAGPLTTNIPRGSRMHFTQHGLRDDYNALAARVCVDLDFVALTSIAAIVCTFGFKMDSASVIIGAMVLSPLLYPVICVGAAAQRRDWATLFHAVRTFAIGLIIAIAAAATTSALFAPAYRSEITSRLNSAPLDYLCVAFFSGLAGTYAYFSPKLHEAVVGIAVSVALIPPIVMLAIGVSRLDNQIMGSGVLIAGLNVLGIVAGSMAMSAALHVITPKAPN